MPRARFWQKEQSLPIDYIAESAQNLQDQIKYFNISPFGGINKTLGTCAKQTTKATQTFHYLTGSS